MKKQISKIIFMFLFSYFYTNSQALWTTGGNGNGQLGDGDGPYRSMWTLISIDMNWKTVSSGAHHSVALKSDGSLWAWGTGIYGQIGNGLNKVNNSFPIRIGLDNDWIAIKCGYDFTVAQKKDGSLWAWGDNSKGQLGDGTNINKNIPIRVGTDKNWESIACGMYFVLALKQDGSLWAWGANEVGQLGDGTNSNKNTPKRIGNDIDWKSINCGVYHSIVLKQDGSLWSWGSNQSGELGDGTKISKNKPIRVGLDNDWEKISGGDYFTIAIKQNGSLWVWGSNYFGQLGDGTEIDRLVPIQLGNDYDWYEVYTNWQIYVNTLAIKKDSTLWGWGRNDMGQLGDNKFSPYLIPTLINNEKNWISLACGYDHSVALRSTSAPAINSSALLSDTAFILKDRSCIPLTLYFNKITPAQQKKGTFTISLAYNSLALRYLEGLPSQYKVSTTISNNRETLIITSDSIMFTGNDTINLSLCFNTYLADSLKNVISITNFDFTGKNNAITRDGTIEFLGCKIEIRKIEINPILLEISPNPVKDKLTINYKGYDDNELITIMNIVGATLIETTINESMDVSNLSSGLYFFKIRNQVFKFVKE